MPSSLTHEIIELLQAFSQHSLRDTTFFTITLEHANDSGKHEKIGALAFQGKYVSRLFSTMHKQGVEGEHFEKLKQEFALALQEFRLSLKSLIEDMPPENTERFEQHYFAINESALKHCLDLASDFSWLKEWELAMIENQRDTRLK